MLSIILLYSFSLFSQTVNIKGKVLSAQDNLPISEVNILIKGTTIGTSTDNNGNYQINNVKLPCEIKFSHLNYFTQNRKLSKKDIINGKIHLDIYLNEKIQTLNEFVVTDNKLHLIANDIIEKVYNKNTYFSINCSWCKNMNTLCKVYYDSIEKDIRFKIVYFHEYDCDDWIMPQIDDNLIVYGNKTYNKENFELMMGNKSEELIEKVCTKWRSVHLKNKKFHNDKKSSVFFKFDEDYVYIFNFNKHIIYKLDKEFHLLQTVNIDETISTPNDILITDHQCYTLYEKYIEQLDLNNGKPIQTIKLLLQNVSNIKIMDNNIYYIKTMQLYNSVTVNNLYLQEM